MRILFIHEVGYLSKPIFEMHEFPELLALEGHDIYFLDFEEKGSFRNPLPQRIMGRVYSNAQLTLQHSNMIGGGLISRAATAMLALPIVIASLIVARPHVVVTYSAPTLGWQAAGICRLLGIPSVFRSIDVLSEIRGGAFSKLVQLSENILLRLVGAVSTHNDSLGSYLKTLSRGKSLNVEVHLPPLVLPAPERDFRRPTREELGFGDRDIVVVFMGTLFPFSGVLDLVREFLGSCLPSLRLLIMGDGALAPEINALIVGSENSDQIRYLGFVPHDMIWDYFEISDIAVNPFEKTLVTDAALPNKILQYQAAGLPVVSTDLMGARGLIGEENGVIWCSGLQEIMSKLQELSTDEPTRTRLSEESLAFVGREFGSSSKGNKQVAAFQAYLEKVSKREWF